MLLQPSLHEPNLCLAVYHPYLASAPLYIIRTSSLSRCISSVPRLCSAVYHPYLASAPLYIIRTSPLLHCISSVPRLCSTVYHPYLASAPLYIIRTSPLLHCISSVPRLCSTVYHPYLASAPLYIIRTSPLLRCQLPSTTSGSRASGFSRVPIKYRSKDTPALGWQPPHVGTYELFITDQWLLKMSFLIIFIISNYYLNDFLHAAV